MGMPKGRKAGDRTTAGSSGEKADTGRARLMRAKAHKADSKLPPSSAPYSRSMRSSRPGSSSSPRSAPGAWRCPRSSRRGLQ